MQTPTFLEARSPAAASAVSAAASAAASSAGAASSVAVSSAAGSEELALNAAGADLFYIRTTQKPDSSESGFYRIIFK